MENSFKVKKNERNVHGYIEQTTRPVFRPLFMTGGCYKTYDSALGQNCRSMIYSMEQLLGC